MRIKAGLSIQSRVVLVFVTFASCCQSNSARYAKLGDRTIDLQQVQSEHLAYANRFRMTMADLYDDLSETAPSDAARAFALQRKVGNAQALLRHTTLQNPVGG